MTRGGGIPSSLAADIEFVLRDGLATALNADVYHLLPSDYEGVQKALMEGKPIQSSTALGKSMARLADRLAGREDPARKSSSLSGLLSLFTRTSA